MQKQKLILSPTVLIAAGAGACDVLQAYGWSVSPETQSLEIIQAVSLRALDEKSSDEMELNVCQGSLSKVYEHLRSLNKKRFITQCKDWEASRNSYLGDIQSAARAISDALVECRNVEVVTRARRVVEGAEHDFHYEIPSGPLEVNIFVLTSLADSDCDAYVADLSYLIRHIIRDSKIQKARLILVILSPKLTSKAEKAHAFSFLSKLNSYFNSRSYGYKTNYSFEVKGYTPADKVLYVDGTNSTTNYTLSEDHYRLLLTKVLSLLTFCPQVRTILFSSHVDSGVSVVSEPASTDLRLSGVGLFAVEFPVRNLIEISALRRTAEFFQVDLLGDWTRLEEIEDVTQTIKTSVGLEPSQVIEVVRLLSAKNEFEEAISQIFKIKAEHLWNPSLLRETLKNLESQAESLLQKGAKKCEPEILEREISQKAALLKDKLTNVFDNELNGLSKIFLIIQKLRSSLEKDYRDAQAYLELLTKEIESRQWALGLCWKEVEENIFKKSLLRISTIRLLIRAGIGMAIFWLLSLLPIPGLNLTGSLLIVFLVIVFLSILVVSVLIRFLKVGRLVDRLFAAYQILFFEKHAKMRGERTILFYRLLLSGKETDSEKQAPSPIDQLEKRFNSLKKRLGSLAKHVRKREEEAMKELIGSGSVFNQVLWGTEKDIRDFYERYVTGRINAKTLLEKLNPISGLLNSGADPLNKCNSFVKSSLSFLLSNDEFLVEKQLQKENRVCNARKLLDIWRSIGSPWWSIPIDYLNKDQLTQVLLVADEGNTIFREAASKYTNFHLLSTDYPFAIRFYSFASDLPFTELANVKDWAKIYDSFQFADPAQKKGSEVK